jgi:hypothetical protein
MNLVQWVFVSGFDGRYNAGVAFISSSIGLWLEHRLLKLVMVHFKLGKLTNAMLRISGLYNRLLGKSVVDSGAQIPYIFLLSMRIV